MRSSSSGCAPPGAVILGKTNLSEWANFRSTKSSSGWSGRGGQTKNPYALDRNPCGSSSGTGSAIAANLAAIGVGTETDGSIVCPSSVAGLVGIKPTVGLVSRSGIIPISHSQDTAGPMTRTVADAAVLLTAMTGVDARDIATTGLVRQGRRLLEGSRLRGAQGRAHRRSAQALLRVQPRRRPGDRGGHCRDEDARRGHRRSRGHSNRVDDRRLRARHPALRVQGRSRTPISAGLGPSAKVRSLADVIAFNEREKAREMPFFGQELFVMAEKKGPLTSPAYRRSARHLPVARACARHRRGHDSPAPRRDRGADGKPSLADRSR